MKKKKTLIVAKTDYGVQSANSSAYSITLQLDKTILEGVGSSILEALRAIKKPVKITTKSILTVTLGDKKHSRALTIPLAKRLFYPSAQQYIAKNLSLFFK